MSLSESERLRRLRASQVTYTRCPNPGDAGFQTELLRIRTVGSAQSTFTAPITAPCSTSSPAWTTTGEPPALYVTPRLCGVAQNLCNQSTQPQVFSTPCCTFTAISSVNIAACGGDPQTYKATPTRVRDVALNNKLRNSFGCSV